MYLFSLNLAFGGLALLILLKVVSSHVKKRSRQAEAARRGCHPPPLVPSKGFLGIGRLRESIRATKEERGPQYIMEAMDEVGKDVHTVRAGILDYELILTRDPENVKAMFAGQATDFDIGTHRPDSFAPLLGNGVFTNRGQEWKHSRAMVRPQFAREQVADLSLFEKHLQSLLKRLPTGQDSWTAKADLSPLFFNFTLDAITDFIYGSSTHAQDPEARAKLAISWVRNAPDLANFGHHINEAKMWIDRRGALAKYNWLLNSKAFSNHCSAIHKFVDFFVHEKLSRGYNENNIETSTKSNRIVLLDELVKETQDPITLRNETLQVLIAGRDTAAATLGWIFYFLARHPAVFDKLRGELVNTFGTNASATDITFKSLWSIPYLQYVLNETLRVVAIVPMNERAAVRDTTLPRGGGPDGQSPIFIAKGQQVLVPTYAMQHRADIWGSDVEDFKPERWADRKFGWDFIPFGGKLNPAIFSLDSSLQC